MPRVVDATLLLLQENAVCQLVESDSEIDDDDTEHDEVLMDAVSDLLPAFAKAMGSNFAPIFSKLFDPLMRFAVGGIVAFCYQSICSFYAGQLLALISYLSHVLNYRKLHDHHKIEPWWLHVLQKLLRIWVLQLVVMLM